MLTNKEMLNISGGGINWTTIGLIGALITFVAGIVDGILRPLSCK